MARPVPQPLRPSSRGPLPVKVPTAVPSAPGSRIRRDQPGGDAWRASRDSKSGWVQQLHHAAAVLIGVALVTGAVLASVGRGPAMDETGHHHWSHDVEELTLRNRAAFAGGVPEAMVEVKHEQLGIRAEYTDGIKLSARDYDQKTTEAIVAALHRGPTPREALQEANQRFSEAQRLPRVDGRAPGTPTLHPSWHQELASGQRAFYRLGLYDSCDADGDVVTILLDSEVFATVPIGHDMASLCLPVRTGEPMSRISVRGERDGAGGITAAFRTSTGDFLLGSLETGQTAILSAVGQ